MIAGNTNTGKVALQTFFSFIIKALAEWWAQKASVLQYTILEELARDKHYSLLGPLISYKDCQYSPWVPGKYYLLD